MTQLRKRAPWISAGLLTFMTAVFGYGIYWVYTDREHFLGWIEEDGFAEWMTCLALFAASMLALTQSVVFRRSERKGASIVWLVAGLAFLFGALEEISYGQRVFGWGTPEWFAVHNTQKETNLHNLRLGGVKINTLVFGKILAVLIALYMLVLTALHRWSGWTRERVNRWGIPIARLHQIGLFIALTILAQLGRKTAEKMGELQEFCGAFIFLAILIHPQNQESFDA